MLEEKARLSLPASGGPGAFQEKAGGLEDRLPAPPGGVRRRLRAASRARLISTVSIVVFMLLWEGVVRLHLVNPLFTSSPTRIAEAFAQMIHEGSLGKDLRVSGSEFLLGYALAVVVLPGAVPFLIAGLRLGLGQALVGIVVGELYAATAGIGYEIAVAGETFQTDRVFVGIAILASTAILLMWGLRRLEMRFESWRPQRQGAGR